MSKLVGPDDLSRIWQVWIQAHARLRGLELQSVPEGFYVEVGRRQQSGRYLITSAGEEAALALLSRAQQPETYVEIPAPSWRLRKLLPAGWRFGPPSHLMSCELDNIARVDWFERGYVARETTVADRLEIRIHKADQVVSSGTCLITDGYAVFDEISTDVHHRRRGLGRYVVSHLARAAADRDATLGVLVATADGKRLYDGAGWSELCEVSTLIGPFSPSET